MSSYYGDKTRDVPSWDSLDRAEDDDIIRSEVRLLLPPCQILRLFTDWMTTVPICQSGPHLILHRCFVDDATAASGRAK